MKTSDHLSFVMVGHVDHGKSTLIGRLLYDTGSLATDKIKELNHFTPVGEKTQFAFLLDHLEEERTNMMTIDTTQVFFGTKNRQYTLVDAPGHAELMKNMLTGAAAAEAAVLVIDVERGLEIQTYRHTQALDMLKLDPVIVAVNKMDLVEHNEQVFIGVRDAVKELFSKLSVRLMECIPVSAIDGDNVAIRSTNMPWYTGPTLLDALENINKESLMNQVFVFPIQDIIKKKGKKYFLVV